MTDPTTRELITDLLAALKSWSPTGGGPLEGAEEQYEAALIAKAEAFLAQPEPQTPSWRELFDLLMQSGGNNRAFSNEWLEPFAQAILARWGRSTLQPVSVSERLPKPEDCDAEGKCWWGRPSEELCNSDWFLATRAEVDEFCDAWPPTVFVPHWALPVPTKAS